MSYMRKENTPKKRIIVKSVKRTTILLSFKDINGHFSNNYIKPVRSNLFDLAKKNFNKKNKNINSIKNVYNSNENIIDYNKKIVRIPGLCYCGYRISRVLNNANGEWYVICSKTRGPLRECQI